MLESLFTFVAFERLLRAVRQCMPVQPRLVKESLVALVALKSELLLVHERDVFRQRRLREELPGTGFTFPFLLLFVNGLDVLCKCAPLGETLRAELAKERS